MTDGLEDHEDGQHRRKCNNKPIRFAAYVDGSAGYVQELAKVDRLDKTSASHGMEISAENTKPNNVPRQHTRRDQCEWTQAKNGI